MRAAMHEEAALQGTARSSRSALLACGARATAVGNGAKACFRGCYVVRTVLKEERDYYDEKFDQLSRQYPNQHLVVRGQQVIGAYPSCGEAIGAVYAKGIKGGELVRKSGTREDTLVPPVLVGG